MIPILDTHLHLVYRDRLSYPWLAGVPALDRDWHFESYRAEAAPLGITGSLHMEVDVAESDIEIESRFVLGLGTGLVGAISSARPESDGFPEELDRLAAIPGVCGIRRVLHTSDDSLSQQPRFAANLNRLAGRGLPFDLCILARQHRTVGLPLLEKCPDVQFVLDHCGVPDIAGKDHAAWSASLAELAAHPNLACKISGIIAYAGPDWTLDDLRPYFETAIDLFGWDRVVWGSDFPVCTLTASLTKWVEATRTLLAGASVPEQERLLHRNASRIYRLPPAV